MNVNTNISEVFVKMLTPIRLVIQIINNCFFVTHRVCYKCDILIKLNILFFFRKRSQPVRGDLIPDPDKLLSYKKHEGHKKEEEEMEDPTVPGGVKPREPRMPGDEPAERKRSTVTFSKVVETIDA